MIQIFKNDTDPLSKSMDPVSNSVKLPSPIIKSVAIIGSKEQLGFEFGCATELFVRQQLSGISGYRASIVCTDTFADDSIEALTVRLFQFQMLLLTDSQCLDAKNSTTLLTVLRQFHQMGGRLVAFGGGAFVLAATGLLDGKKVPHDNNHSAQQAKYPNVMFNGKEPFYYESGLYCGGFGFDSLELGLYLIARDFGGEYVDYIVEKLKLSASLVTSTMSKLNSRVSSRIQSVLDWAEKNLEEIDNVDQLAAQAYLSRRSFDRQFRAAVGVSAKDWLTQKRLLRAKQYLSSSELSIEEIACITGFGNSNNFRNNFQKVIGHSPTAYRREVSLQ